MPKKLINVRIDENLKKQVMTKCIEVGTDLTKLVTEFLTQFVK